MKKKKDKKKKKKKKKKIIKVSPNNPPYLFLCLHHKLCFKSNFPLSGPYL